jgi:hypothetical protein
MKTVQWKAITDCPGWEVNSKGEIRSWRKAGRGNTLRAEPKPVKVFRNVQTGYLQVGYFLEKGKVLNTYVHQMVANAFLEPKPDGAWVCHKNGNYLDCQASNLYWGTPKSNGEDASRHATEVKFVKKEYVDELTLRAKKFIADNAEEFSINEDVVFRILLGNQIQIY